MALVVPGGRSPARGDALTDTIRIRGLELECIVGTLLHERETPQRIVVNIALEANLVAAARSGRIHQTVDYDRVSREVSLLLQFREYRLLEMAVEETCAMLLGLHSGLESARVEIEKPAALPGRARAASVEFRRTPLDFPPLEGLAGGGRRVLLQTREAQLETWRVGPGESIAGACEFAATGVQWLTEGSLSRAGAPLEFDLPVGAQHVLASDCPQLVNVTERPARLFRCWRRS